MLEDKLSRLRHVMLSFGRQKSPQAAIGDGQWFYSIRRFTHPKGYVQQMMLRAPFRHSATASTARRWNSLRMSEASLFGRPMRWIISTKIIFRSGSIQPCVPKAPPWP